MKYDLRKQLIMLSRQAIYVLLLLYMGQSFLFAMDSHGQSIHDVRISVDFQDNSIEEALSKIERETNFRFAYGNDVKGIKSNLKRQYTNATVAEILKHISNHTGIEFQQINKTISAKYNPPVVQNSPPVTQIESIEKVTVKGTVTDENGATIPGVNIIEKGTANGTVTDIDGAYQIVVDDRSTLIFSFIGYISQEIVVSNQNRVDVVLKKDVGELEEVVVVAYGEQKRETVTGSISTVDMADMKTPVRSLTNALAGKVAGVISMQSSGEPGYDNSNFTIRGIGTFTGNASPLIIIDGVQRDDVNSTFAGAYNNIDPEDIQSISLLKDASATALFGAKGANGVLIITTKRGTKGKPKISVKAETGVSGFTKTPEMVDAVTYMQLYNEARINSGENPIYSEEVIQKTASGLDPYLYPDVNWVRSIYKDWAQMYNVNMNVSGGSDAIRYYTSMSYYNQQGSYKVSNINGYDPNLKFERYDFRSNVDIDISSTTEFSLSLAAMLVNARYPGVSAGSIWYSAYATNPISFPVQYPDGKFAGPVNNGGTNPYNSVQNSGYSTEFRPTVQSIFTINQNLDAVTPGLTARGRFSFDSYSINNNSRTGVNDLWYAGSRDTNGELVYTQTRFGQDFLGYSQSASAERTMYLEANINYDRIFGKHNFGGLLLYNMRNRIQSTAGSAIGSIPYRNQGLSGRIMYAYDEKYLIEVNAGYTGSENFSDGNRFGFFPAISGGWVVSNEDFFDAIEDKISLLKLRGSYGLVGNDQIGQGGRFPYLTQIQGSTGASFGFSNSYYGGIAETQLGVENLTWEVATKTNIGLEMGLFKKVNLIVEAFRDKRTNILISRGTISPIAGYSDLTIYANLGEMVNEGLDGSLEYKDNIGQNVWLRLFGNFTYSNNKIIFQDEPTRQYAYQQGAGHAYPEFTGYIAEGLFKDQEDIDQSPVHTFGTVQPGDIKYKDLNNDGIIDAGDWTYLGKTSFPALSYGLGFSVAYKRLDLSMLFQGVQDVGLMVNGASISSGDGSAGGVGLVPFAGIGQYPGNILSVVNDRWTEENPRQDAAYPRLSIANQNDNNYQSSTWWLKDGSYCRLKQASLGYTLPTNVGNGKVSDLYFYLSGQNLLTFSKFKLWDPELGPNGAKYPLARTITLGIRAEF